VSRTSGSVASDRGHSRRRRKWERKAHAKSDRRPRSADDSDSLLPFQSTSQTPQRTPHQAMQPDTDGEVEPDDGVSCGENEVAELVLVGPVDDPAVRGHDRLDPGAQLGVGCLDPAWPVDERVELDERDAEPPGKLPPERRLAVAAGTGDERDLPHRHRIVVPVFHRAMLTRLPSGRRGARSRSAGAGEGPHGREVRMQRSPGARGPARVAPQRSSLRAGTGAA